MFYVEAFLLLLMFSNVKGSDSIVKLEVRFNNFCEESKNGYRL